MARRPRNAPAADRARPAPARRRRRRGGKPGLPLWRVFAALFVITVLRRPDDSIAALEIAWTGPDAMPGMTIEHAVGFLDYRPDANTIVAHQSWSELVAGYRAARVEPAPEPPRAGTI